MGTVVGVDLRGHDPGAAAATDAVFAWMHDVDARFSTYRSDSDVQRLERGDIALAGCAPDVVRVLARCQELLAATGGWFDVRAGGRLDPSAYVKGWSVERAALLLHARGIRRYCINAGGDVRVGDAPARGEPWHVGIRHPHDGAEIAAAVSVCNLAIATSGAYERGVHIVDPHTGGTPQGVLSTTVVGPDLGTADAYATAAFAMGREGIAWLARIPGYGGMAIHDDGTVVSTTAFDALRIA
jgi:FAD:protein FMN transferase